MGVTADAATRAFNSEDVKRFYARPGVTVKRDVLNMYDNSNTNHIILAVDPSGGGQSAFAISSLCYTPNGHIVVRRSLYTRPRPRPRRPVAQRLACPQLSQRHTQLHQGVGPLARVGHKARYHKWQHALRHVLAVGPVVRRQLGLVHQRKEQCRALARCTDGRRAVQSTHGAHLRIRVRGLLVGAVHAPQEHADALQIVAECGYGRVDRTAVHAAVHTARVQWRAE